MFSTRTNCLNIICCRYRSRRRRRSDNESFGSLGWLEADRAQRSSKTLINIITTTVAILAIQTVVARTAINIIIAAVVLAKLLTVRIGPLGSAWIAFDRLDSGTCAEDRRCYYGRSYQARLSGFHSHK